MLPPNRRCSESLKLSVSLTIRPSPSCSNALNLKPYVSRAPLVREVHHLAAQIELTIRSLAATGQPLAAAVAQQAVAARETLWRLELGDP